MEDGPPNLLIRIVSIKLLPLEDGPQKRTLLMEVGPFNYIGGAQDIGPDFWEAQGQVGEGIVRLLNADPFGEQISLKNFGDAEADISDYFFCLGPGQYNALSDYSNVDGDLSLAPDETVTFDLTSGSQNVTALPDDEAALALFAIGGNFGSSDPEILLDFLQYGNPNQNRVDQAVTAGRWTSEEDFVDGVGPFNYIGGAQDIGPDFWEAQGQVGEGIVRLLNADPFGEQISLKNFGDAEADISDYFFCLGPGQYNALSDYSNVDGDLSLAPDETVTFDLTSGSQNVTALPDDEAALALFAIGGNFGSSDPEILLDFLQYGNPNQNRVDQAVTAGRWTSEEDFVDGKGPYNYIGGAQDIGPDFWIDETIIRMVQIVPEEDLVRLKNFDDVSRNISGYFFCTKAGVYRSIR